MNVCDSRASVSGATKLLGRSASQCRHCSLGERGATGPRIARASLKSPHGSNIFALIHFDDCPNEHRRHRPCTTGTAHMGMQGCTTAATSGRSTTLSCMDEKLQASVAQARDLHFVRVTRSGKFLYERQSPDHSARAAPQWNGPMRLADSVSIGAPLPRVGRRPSFDLGCERVMVNE